MSKIVDSYPANKKSRKEKILKAQEKKDNKIFRERKAALALEEKKRIARTKGKVQRKREEAAARENSKASIEFDFASDASGELAVNEKLSDSELDSIKGTGKDGAITVDDIKAVLKDRK